MLTVALLLAAGQFGSFVGQGPVFPSSQLRPAFLAPLLTSSAPVTRPAGTAVTTTRAGTATNYDENLSPSLVSASANTARYHSTKGLLSEAAATNLALQSEAIDTATWTKEAGVTVTANGAVAPDGTTTMDLVDNTAGADALKSAYQSVAVSSTTGPLTHSSFARPNGASSLATVGVGCAGTTPATCACTVSSGTCATVINASNCAAYSTITAPVRLTATMTCNAAFTTAFPLVTGGQFGTSKGAAFFWGSQLETGSVATSYIPTTTAAVTRNADVHTVPATGWPTTSGEVSVVYTPTSAALPASNHTLVDSTTTGTSQGFRLLRNTSNQIEFAVYAAAQVCAITPTLQTWTADVALTIEARWTPTSCEVFVNGTSIGGAGVATGSPASHDTAANIGSNLDGVGIGIGYFRNVCVGAPGRCN